jgi:hypothetical protein
MFVSTPKCKCMYIASIHEMVYESKIGYEVDVWGVK